MKANEAPERIWINSPQDFPCGFVDKNSVEYVRKDAIIEKACKYISCHQCEYIDFDDFKKYMREE